MSKSKPTGDVRHGKHSKYEVMKQEKVVADSTYTVRKDDEPASGSFKSRKDAVDWAEEKSGDTGQ